MRPALRLAPIALLVILALAYFTSSPSPSRTLDFVKDSEAYMALLNEINGASESIYVVMFIIKYDPDDPDDPVNDLLHALVRAKGRGLNVRVLVDDETLESYPETIAFLKGNGIDVRLDESGEVRTHAKMVVVDGRTLYVGSHNWTESALRYNHEAGLVVKDGEVVGEAENYFLRLWGAGREV